MECNVARQLLAFRRSGGPAELAPEDAADLARHLAGCPACAAVAGRQEAFDTAVATAMKGVTVPIDETVDSFEMLVQGGLDDLPEQAFLNVGNAEAARAKGKQLLEDS